MTLKEYLSAANNGTEYFHLSLIHISEPTRH